MNVVYVVEHRDIEDDKYVRAVFETPEAARVHVMVPELCTEHGWSKSEGKDYPHVKRAAWGGGDRDQPTDAAGCFQTRQHYDWCCRVTAYEVHKGDKKGDIPVSTHE